MNDLVSIIMPAYNTGEYIKKSINSVIDQTYKNWELLVIDDCSTDNTEEVIKSFNDERIIYLKNKENSGIAVSRNNGIKEAKGRWIAFLDSDDSWKENKLEKQIRFMINNGYEFTSTAYELIDENGIKLNKLIIPPKKIGYTKFVLLSCPIGNLTAIYDTKRIGKIYVPIIKKRNDFALWLQVLKETGFCYSMEENLAEYTMGRTGSVSKNKVGLMKYHWKLYRHIEGHGVIRSSFEVMSWVFVKVTGIGRKIVNI